MSYKHLSIIERERLMFYRAQSLSICQIALQLGRNKSTISRELKRNDKDYSPSKAQTRYQRRRKKACSHKKLATPELFNLVKKLFLCEHWSPEQIAQRLKLENYPIRVSYKTIYRAIYSGMFDTPEQKRSTGNRGKIPITNELSARPVEANERSRFGDFEADTIVGKNRKSGLLTLVDRKSRFLLCSKLSRFGSEKVKATLIEVLRGKELCSITPDRGREFQLHGEVTKTSGIFSERL